MKKYILVCLLIVGASVPCKARVTIGCINITKKECDAWTPEQWKEHCADNRMGTYVRHEWSMECKHAVYGTPGCAYWCESQ